MQRLHDLLIGAAGTVLPNTGFEFGEKGALSPAGFMAAGDAIIASDARWHWVSDHTGASMECLVADKQYLRAYDVPCLRLRRISGSDDLYDHGTAAKPQRLYDISITYDRYYETPRIWLVGFNAFGLALPQDEMLQDVPPAYAGKTVTIARHPYTGKLNMTVHPCYQMEAIHRQHHSEETYRSENAIAFALEIWASVLPTFCLVENDRKNEEAVLSDDNLYS
ncbi:autophagy-related protein 3 [Babesia caballi]|uniref:Autophagy-related protein 3 n=1 Tax=Babesia caballi TaxID=5871 RepID=A0AAV4M0E0_BABCB|nr:autophagy-related protein 3 [Babesia caballi]